MRWRVAEACLERDQARREREGIRAEHMAECESLRASAVEIAAERDRLRQELDALRAAPVPVEIEPGPGVDLTPLVEPMQAGAPILAPDAAPSPPGKGTIRAVLAMHGMGATPAEIAKELALRPEVVRQVLKEAGA